MRKRNTRTTDLRAELSNALRAGRLDDALAAYELIEKRRPDEARWAHRKADLLKRMGRENEAVAAYERAIDLYVARGFIERAIATAKVMLCIDRTKIAVLARLEQEAAAAEGSRQRMLVMAHAGAHHRR
jgi:tetratricopeptide (TPR) repeat protein